MIGNRFRHMNLKFILYALLISLISSTASWSRMLAGAEAAAGAGSRSGSSWSSNTGGGGWSSGGGSSGGGHK
jgi:uncharacterized membrane protein YgcG